MIFYKKFHEKGLTMHLKRCIIISETRTQGKAQKQEVHTMKEYIVRLRNYRGSIIDGEIYTAPNKCEALKMYKARCYRLGIAICKYDYFTVDEM